MAKKKDFKSITKAEINDIGAITRGMFSTETKEKVNKIVSEEKKKRNYTRLLSKENRTRTISLRLTEKEYKDLIKKAEKSQSGTISNYILNLIKGVN